MTLNVGSRGSRLALIQAATAIRILGIEGDVVAVKTKADTSRKALKELGGRAFTRELDEALLAGDIDLAVHSLKDIPVEDFPDALKIACVVERDDSRDCLVSNKGVLAELPEGAVVGASSERRKAELLNLRGDLRVKPLRGNVPTRLEKLGLGEYDAIITAKCALDRLGLDERATQVFEVEEMVPAAGQGAIAVVTRKGFPLSIPREIKANMPACTLERFFIKDLGACRNPVGAYCKGLGGGSYRLTGLFFSDGVRIMPAFEGSAGEIRSAIDAWRRENL